MKEKIICLSFLIALLVSCASIGIESQEPKDVYKHWFKEEVALLLMAEERKEFSELTTYEEKERFIENFWARRDPDPSTERNEFKEEWYERLDYVTRTFTRGTKKGWRSDQGKIWLFFGKPWRTHLSPTSIREAPYGGHQQELGRQVWIYKEKPELGITQPYFQVVFSEYQYGYDLDETTPQIIRRALEIYPKSVVKR